MVIWPWICGGRVIPQASVLLDKQRGARRARGQYGSSNPPYSKVVECVCVCACVCLHLSAWRHVCLCDLAFWALNMMLAYLWESGLNERPGFLFTFCICVIVNLQVCVCVCVCFPHVCWTCRGEGDVMFSLCLANPVVSTPNSRVYGV